MVNQSEMADQDQSVVQNFVPFKVMFKTPVEDWHEITIDSPDDFRIDFWEILRKSGEEVIGWGNMLEGTMNELALLPKGPNSKDSKKEKKIQSLEELERMMKSVVENTPFFVGLHFFILLKDKDSDRAKCQYSKGFGFEVFSNTTHSPTNNIAETFGTDKVVISNMLGRSGLIDKAIKTEIINESVNGPAIMNIQNSTFTGPVKLVNRSTSKHYICVYCKTRFEPWRTDHSAELITKYCLDCFEEMGHPTCMYCKKHFDPWRSEDSGEFCLDCYEQMDNPNMR